MVFIEIYRYRLEKQRRRISTAVKQSTCNLQEISIHTKQLLTLILLNNSNTAERRGAHHLTHTYRYLVLIATFQRHLYTHSNTLTAVLTAAADTNIIPEKHRARYIRMDTNLTRICYIRQHFNGSYRLTLYLVHGSHTPTVSMHLCVHCNTPTVKLAAAENQTAPTANTLLRQHLWKTGQQMSTQPYLNHHSNGNYSYVPTILRPCYFGGL